MKMYVLSFTKSQVKCMCVEGQGDKNITEFSSLSQTNMGYGQRKNNNQIFKHPLTNMASADLLVSHRLEGEPFGKQHRFVLNLFRNI